MLHILSGLYAWFDRNILELGREMRLTYLPPLMVYVAAGVSGLTAIVGTFFVKDYLGLSAEFLAALGFWAGGIAILSGQSWWQTMVAGSAAFSAAIFVLLWDGDLQKLHDKGAIAILLNLAILVAVLILHWPDIGS